MDVDTLKVVAMFAVLLLLIVVSIDPDADGDL